MVPSTAPAKKPLHERGSLLLPVDLGYVFTLPGIRSLLSRLTAFLLLPGHVRLAALLLLLPALLLPALFFLFPPLIVRPVTLLTLLLAHSTLLTLCIHLAFSISGLH